MVEKKCILIEEYNQVLMNTLIESTIRVGEPFGGGFFVGMVGGEAIVVAPKKNGETKSLWIGGNDKSDGRNNEISPWASKISIGGFNDWYIPSKDEFKLIRNKASKLPKEAQFTNDLYWTSTEYDKKFGYLQYIDANYLGSAYNADKTYINKVRVIRRHKVHN